MIRSFRTLNCEFIFTEMWRTAILSYMQDFLWREQGREQTITLKVTDQGRSDFYVVFTMSLCALGLKQLLISYNCLLFQIIWL